VSSRYVDALVRAAHLAGFEPDHALRRSLALQESKRDPDGRISWDEFVDFFLSLYRLAGADEGLVRLGAVWPDTHPWQSAVAKTFPDAKAYYSFTLGPGSNSAYPHISNSLTADPGNRLRLDWALPPKHRDCPEFWRFNTQVFGALGRWFSGIRTEVRAEIGERHARYWIELPSVAPSTEPTSGLLRSLTAEIASANRAVVSFYRELKQDGSIGESARFLNRVTAVRLAWKLTPRETETLRGLATGASNKEIAASMGCTVGTVEAHVKRVFDKAGTESRARLIAVFWESA